MDRWRALSLLGPMLLVSACATAPPLPAGYQASPDEVAAVRQILAANEQAINARDLNALTASYADDAKIDSLAAGGTVGKPAYRDAMARVFAGGTALRASYGTPSIGFADPTHATIQVGATQGTRPSRIQYQLEKREGRWLIVNQKYL